MKVLLLAAEMEPYVKVGGLGDVAGALPAALRRLGHDVRVVIPLHGRIDPERWNFTRTVESFDFPAAWETIYASLWEGEHGGVPIYAIDIPWLFGNRHNVYGDGDDTRRYMLFTAAALRAMERIDWKPDILHANDWHTALAPIMLHNGSAGSFYSGSAAVLTLHNIAYQGWAARPALDGAVAFLPHWYPNGWVNLMELGLRTTSIITAVSPTFAGEIQTPDGGAGLDWLLRERSNRLRGVLNGIDTDAFNPEKDPAIAARFGGKKLAGKAACKRALQEEAGFQPDPSVPVIGMVARLVDQKGFDLAAAALEHLLATESFQFIVEGTGQPNYHDLLEQLQARYPGRVRAWLKYDAELAQRIYAGSDMFLVPSRFEPCGLTQMIAMRYGTVPIARHTGGLADTVFEGPPGDPRTGFVFWPAESTHLADAICRALATFRKPKEWKRLVQNDLAQDFSWARSAQTYSRLYECALDGSLPLPD